ncbi:MAG: hypothetical protein JXD23_03865 [Spirochaetales bacterium]|nr:hypothetical protein [Spirochaetales bacterium]
MAVKKLTPTEISKTVEKIRKKYDEYVFKYFKPARHKSNFEKRYVDALKAGVDISTFLLAEISAVEELVKREEAKVMEKPPAKPAPAGKTFVDQVLDENRRRIAKYPDLRIHSDAREEVRKLYGALNKLEQEYWPSLYSVLRTISSSVNTKSMIALEGQLHTLGGKPRSGVAVRLERYLAHLARFPRDYVLLEKEEKDYILESSFFLHELEDMIESAKQKHEPVLKEAEKKQLARTIEYIHGVISDFRLKELKRK